MAAATVEELKRLQERFPRARVVNAARVDGRLTYQLLHDDPAETGSLFFKNARMNFCPQSDRETVERQARCQNNEGDVYERLR